MGTATTEVSYQRLTVPAWRVAVILVAIGSILAPWSAFGTSVALGSGPQGEKLLHLPMRWCVLKGTAAANDPNAAVLRKLRRGAKVWANQGRFTLTSALYTMGAAA